jgi:hypothetical protein
LITSDRGPFHRQTSPQALAACDDEVVLALVDLDGTLVDREVTS